MQSEDLMQSEMVKWLWNTHPLLRRHFWAVINGAALDIRSAQKLKATGMLSGVWDLHMFWRDHFFIHEQKVGRNQLTRDHLTAGGARVYGQFEWGELMAAHGAIRFINRSLEEFQNNIAWTLQNYP